MCPGYKKGKGKFLYSAASNPQDCSKRFIYASRIICVNRISYHMKYVVHTLYIEANDTQLCELPCVLQELTAIVSEEVCVGIQLNPAGSGRSRLGRNLQVLGLLAALSEHVDPACFSSNQHILQLAQVSATSFIQDSLC